MKEWLLANFDASVVVAICGFIGSVTTAIISLVNASKTRSKLNKVLEDAHERGSYAICPSCKKKIAINEIEFHLANGALDQNLNGLPDDQEK